MAILRSVPIMSHGESCPIGVLAAMRHVSTLSPEDGSSARYLKFVISDAFEYDNQAAGPSSGARCDISEFNVLGEE